MGVTPVDMMPKFALNAVFFINEHFALNTILANKGHLLNNDFIITDEVGNTISTTKLYNHYLELPLSLKLNFLTKYSWQLFIHTGTYQAIILKQSKPISEIAYNFKSYDFGWGRGVGLQKKWDNLILSIELNRKISLIDLSNENGLIDNNNRKYLNNSTELLASIRYKISKNNTESN